MGRKVRIISFDGGPVTPLNLRLLRELERRESFLAETDIFAGTSDGSFAALFLSLWPWEESKEKYGDKAGLVAIEECIRYSNKVFDAFSPSFLGRVRTLGRLVTGIHSGMLHNKVREVVQEAYRGKRLKDCTKKVLVPVFRLKTEFKERYRKPDAKVYHNFALNDPDLSELAVDVYMRSASLPVFMPISSGFVDGAVWANNPSMCAIAQYMMFPDNLVGGERDMDFLDGSHRSRQRSVRELEDVVMLSLGGDSPTFGNQRIQELMSRAEVSWGWGPWLLYPFELFLLFDAFWNGGSRGPVFQSRALLNERFFRLGQVTDRIFKQIMHLVLRGADELLGRAEKMAQVWASGDENILGGKGDSFPETMKWLQEQWHDESQPRDIETVDDSSSVMNA